MNRPAHDSHANVPSLLRVTVVIVDWNILLQLYFLYTHFTIRALNAHGHGALDALGGRGTHVDGRTAGRLWRLWHARLRLDVLLLLRLGRMTELDK